jgi:hypothetical protein
MGTRHTYRLLIKRPLPRPASHTIIHWEALKYIKVRKGESKTLFEKRYRSLYQRYKSYRMFLRLRQWKISDEAGSLMQSQYAKKPRNPE